MVIHLISYFCDQYGIDPNITELVDYTQIYIMPTMNPDGFNLGYRRNANGVDLNRDFPGLVVAKYLFCIRCLKRVDTRRSVP
jgi:carboxypeptidase D